MQENDIQSVKAFLIDLQSRICEALEQEDGKGKFITDQWNRPEGGGGISRVLTDGAIIEKGGVNFSHVFGDNLPASASAHRPEIAGRAFQAMGISLVIHPKNPMAPTSHANVRLFVATKAGEAPIWWFGGGYDLTPYYLFEDDAIHWHQTAKAACDRFSDDYYPRFKAWCDDYFFLKHRAEARGIGGLFFDDINENSFEHCFSFIRSIGNSFIPAYLPILQKRHSMRFTEQQRDYQLHRRGRYVEFNLVFDRGTLFGLQSGGRTESILMSLPPIVKWDYNWQVSADSDEQKLLDVLQNPREWIEQS